MQMASSSSRPKQRFTLCSAIVTCATFLLLAGCGDDGTESLSSCPDYRIATDKSGIQHCAPRAGSGGMPPSTARAGAGAGSSQQPNRGPSAGKPAAGSDGAAAASGTAALPPIPKGGTWTCVQVSTTCSCAMTDTPVDRCMKPMPGCCMLVRDADKYSGCVCYGENSADCNGRKQDPLHYVPVATCPPT
jgi:hypothetical protein